jgi:hypothetical protein
MKRNKFNPLIGKIEYTELSSSNSYSTSGGSLPVYPSSDGFEYYLQVINGVGTWQKIIDANGTPLAQKNKLRAGASGDWVNGSYVGATSGAISTTKGGERFTSQDLTNNNYYKYECIVDNTWIRTQLS